MNQAALQSAVDTAAAMAIEETIPSYVKMRRSQMVEIVRRGSEALARIRWGTLPDGLSSWDEWMSITSYLDGVREFSDSLENVDRSKVLARMLGHLVDD